MAAICERGMLDTDNMLSMVRLIDVVTVGADVPDETMSAAIAQLGAPIQGTLVLVFKGGLLNATHEITVHAHSPSGDVHDFPKVSSVFSSILKGGVPGANVLVRLQMSVKHEGLYWFEVKLDGVTVRSIPLQIVFQGAPLQA